jgi:hypothetical protein
MIVHTSGRFQRSGSSVGWTGRRGGEGGQFLKKMAEISRRFKAVQGVASRCKSVQDVAEIGGVPQKRENVK